MNRPRPEAPAGRLLRDTRAPLSLYPQIAAVADDERGSLRKAQGDNIGAAELDDEAYSPLPKDFFGFGKPFQHERVVAGVRLGVVGG